MGGAGSEFGPVEFEVVGCGFVSVIGDGDVEPVAGVHGVGAIGGDGGEATAADGFSGDGDEREKSGFFDAEDEASVRSFLLIHADDVRGEAG